MDFTINLPVSKIMNTIVIRGKNLLNREHRKSGRISGMWKYSRYFKLLLPLFVVLAASCEFAGKTVDKNTSYHEKGAKYVFLFIGDGMGAKHLAVTEKVFKTEKQPELWINTLPVKGSIRTQSYGGGITDSAAAGTALACGRKTKNGVLGLDHEEKSIESVAEMAKKLGWKIGILSSVPLNHATPAAYYAHRLRRSMYDRISHDLAASNFEYFGGGSLLVKSKRQEVMKTIKDHNYIMIKSPKKMPQLDPGKKYIVHTKLPYVINRNKNSGLTLAEFTRLGIKHLYRGAGKTKGFFMMVEGGKIDWSSHANDGGSMIHEVKDFDDAVKVALDFYKKHPESTTIVVTADHETGSLYFSPTDSASGWTVSGLLRQKHSYDVMCKKLEKYRNRKFPFEKVVPLLQANYGIKKFSPEELKKLRASWKVLSKGKGAGGKSAILYGSYKPLLFCMQSIFNRRCGLTWNTTGHSALPVPVLAIGVGSKIFAGSYENTEIARKLKSLISPATEK